MCSRGTIQAHQRNMAKHSQSQPCARKRYYCPVVQYGMEMSGMYGPCVNLPRLPPRRAACSPLYVRLPGLGTRAALQKLPPGLITLMNN
ncbi:hypothetical protein J6590_061860 [Homalodisca vitripennis]|nr:hypothetical protein J6590_061860 [Homalodisca vitripennis]